MLVASAVHSRTALPSPRPPLHERGAETKLPPMDSLPPAARSENMSRIRSRDTQPELRVRRALHAMGYRFRLHRRDLPGRPDIVLPKYRTVVFVHGCFWHRHPGCPNAAEPKTRAEFWRRKFEANVARDAKARAELERAGWKVVVIWECETENPETLDRVIRERLPAPAGRAPARENRGTA